MAIQFPPTYKLPIPIEDLKCVVPFSGGKDSMACFKMAVGTFGLKHVIGMFNDTKWEHSDTYAFIAKMNEKYDGHIMTVSTPEDANVPALIKKYKAFPNGRMKFCTYILKIQPSGVVYKELAELKGSGYAVYYGMRKEESNDRKLRYSNVTELDEYPPNDINKNYSKKLTALGVRFVLPVLEWDTQKIFDFIGDDVNPLYAKGSERGGCAPCLASGDQTKNFYFELDNEGNEKLKIVNELEQTIGKSAWNSKKFSALSTIKIKKEKPVTICSFCTI